MNLVKNKLLFVILSGGIFISTNATSSDAVITYNYVDLGYVSTDIDDVLPGVDVDGDGGAIRISGSVHPNVH